MKGPPWRREKHSKRGDDDVHDDNNDDDVISTAKTNGEGDGCYYYNCYVDSCCTRLVDSIRVTI